jgi:hypothetical protein
VSLNKLQEAIDLGFINDTCGGQRQDVYRPTTNVLWQPAGGLFSRSNMLEVGIRALDDYMYMTEKGYYSKQKAISRAIHDY